MGQLSINNVISILVVVLLLTIIYYLINIGNKYVKPSNMIVLTRVNVMRTVLALASIIIIFIVFRNYPIIPTTLVTIILAITVAYIINPLVVYFEKKGFKRIVSLIIVYVLIIGLFAILLGIVIPKTVNELKNLIQALPNIVDQTQEQILKFTDSLFKDNAILKDNKLLDDIGENFDKNFKEFISKIQTSFFAWLSNLADRAPNYFSSMLRIILVPVVSFYILLDKEKLIGKTKDAIPQKYKKETLSLFRDIDDTLTEFVRGRLLMAVFVGILTGVVLLILKVDFAIVVGIVTAVADIVPYIGPFIGFLPAVILASIQSPMKGVWVAIIFVLIQWAENNIIGPKILGESVGLHPLVILLSLIIGGGVAGVPGMIFSVPILATLKVVFKHIGPIIKENILKLIRD
ncbi:AI-2E family transporter [Microaceticoccus formicicus]|uniref:AI-2E family transporter n=1 Tax=Microaceticoccus formicicus TaxID=3118105 RepID=UPI003CD0348B|nr:AI-2E family transporter [Peptoniphilaceae bacterium AMB_02]